MGLAAAQARFLGITMRKANCEYRSTQLAQERLEITNQMSDIAQDYSNAMTSTTLLWKNGAVNRDFGVTYSLLMTPSAANDYNPYLVTSSSGAIILNSEYVFAARAAGITKAGGIASADGRDRFISALVQGGIITAQSAKAITSTDYNVVKKSDGMPDVQTPDNVTSAQKVDYNPLAGIGAAPMNKSLTDLSTVRDLITNPDIGQVSIDWASMFATADNPTKKQYNEQLRVYNEAIRNSGDSEGIIENETYTSTTGGASLNKESSYNDYYKEYKRLMDGTELNADNKNTDLNRLSEIAPKYYLIAQRDYYKNKYQGAALDWNSESVNKQFHTGSKNLGDNFAVVNGTTIETTGSNIEKLTIGDLLKSGSCIVLTQKTTDEKEFSDTVKKLFTSIAKQFGYNQPIGTALCVDDASQDALQEAYNQIIVRYLKSGSVVKDSPDKNSSTSVSDNSAYINANNYNRIGQCNEYCAVNLSNMVSAFLTYFAIALDTDTISEYSVGRSVNSETTNYVTDYSDYVYVVKNPETVTDQDIRLADFYDNLYNNICAHGWREDESIDDYEYFESAIKNGRYSLSALNNDGYYYQERYNDVGYMSEELDRDAIARAEAEYTQKKAELNFKEQMIDTKSKNLDAEIAELSTELDSVKNIITKAIEKTFTMYSN